MNVKIHESWRRELQSEFDQPYFAALADFVRRAYAAGEVYPPAKYIFHAFNRTPFDQVKVVILGQDPYHEPDQAQGLAFYVPPSVSAPPSLVNIAKEVGHMPDLISWADQGVLLLNSTLTVAAHAAGSHQGRGWETFTDAVVQRLSQGREHLVFMLWGAYAQRKGSVIDCNRHLVLKAAHPSPLSAYRGFFGCHHFDRCNYYLTEHDIEPIRW